MTKLYPTSTDAQDKAGGIVKVIDADLIEKMEKLFQCSVCLNLPLCDIYQCKRGHLICKGPFLNDVLAFCPQNDAMRRVPRRA